MATNDTKTKWPTDLIGSIVQRTLVLAAELSLDDRLPAGLLDQIRTDGPLFGAKVSAAQGGLDRLKAATASQNAATALGHKLVVAIRQGLVRTNASAAAKKALGVGNRIREDSVPQVAAGLDAIVQNAALYADALAAAGATAVEVDKARTYLAAVRTTDADQEGKKELRKTSTTDRKRAQARIERNVTTFVSVGCIKYHDQPDVVARLEALVPKQTKRKGPPGGGGGGGGGPTKS